jgi:flagellar basal body-associated protein FliL
MRIFVLLAAVATVVVIGYGVSTAFFARSSTVSSDTAAPNTLSPHEIHVNYQGMEKLPVHDVKDAN